MAPLVNSAKIFLLTMLPLCLRLSCPSTPVKYQYAGMRYLGREQCGKHMLRSCHPAVIAEAVTEAVTEAGPVRSLGVLGRELERPKNPLGHQLGAEG